VNRAFYERGVVEVAQDLVGCVLRHGETAGVIVETEAYHESEPACHAHVGLTGRTHILFGPPARAYVYRSYGIHWCLNLVCEDEGVANAVLVRALEPTHGLDAMRARRGLDDPRLLCSGPGRLCEALGVTRAHDGLPLDRPPFELRAREGHVETIAGPRVGITRAATLPWRYAEAASGFLSRPLRPA
jgi:DNA-3-methyladenine glycosylase